MHKEPADCEYLVDGRLCKAITEDPEGRDIRKKFCKNNQKNYCCYLCAHRENCEISCSFLDTTQEKRSLDIGISLKVEQKIKEYEEEKAKLAALFADGKIGEKSYLVATNTLESKIEELKKAKENPRLLQETLGNLHELDLSEEEIKPPTALWYLVPFFFGIIGGIIAYVGTKDEDKGMADSLLLFGIIWTIILAILLLIL